MGKQTNIHLSRFLNGRMVRDEMVFCGIIVTRRVSEGRIKLTI